MIKLNIGWAARFFRPRSGSPPPPALLWRPLEIGYQRDKRHPRVSEQTRKLANAVSYRQEEQADFLLAARLEQIYSSV